MGKNHLVLLRSNTFQNRHQHILLAQNSGFTYLPISKYLTIHLKYTITAHQPQSSQKPLT